VCARSLIPKARALVRFVCSVHGTYQRMPWINGVEWRRWRPPPPSLSQSVFRRRRSRKMFVFCNFPADGTKIERGKWGERGSERTFKIFILFFKRATDKSHYNTECNVPGTRCWIMRLSRFICSVVSFSGCKMGIFMVTEAAGPSRERRVPRIHGGIRKG
jgi:hypothetical protein